MILTPTKLEQIGEALRGPTWGRWLARQLGCSERTIIRYRHGDIAMPRRRREQIADLCRRQAANLQRFADELLS